MVDVIVRISPPKWDKQKPISITLSYHHSYASVWYPPFNYSPWNLMPQSKEIYQILIFVLRKVTFLKFGKPFEIDTIHILFLYIGFWINFEGTALRVDSISSRLEKPYSDVARHFTLREPEGLCSKKDRPVSSRGRLHSIFVRRGKRKVML